MVNRWAWALLPCCAIAQTRSEHVVQDKTVRIRRVSSPLTIDDLLNSKADERGAAKVTDFRQTNPKDGELPTESTTAYLAYDNDHLYIGFVCVAPVKELRARITKREDYFPDDQVGVNLDTFFDRQRTFFFYMNARGIQSDGLYTEGQGDEMSWDTVWKSDGRVTDSGYVALMTIPFRSLRFPNTAKQRWGIVLTRHIARKNEYMWWPHICNNVSGFAQQLGTLEGLESISPGRNLQFNPYGFFARSRFLDRPDGRPARLSTDNTFRGGLDGKAVLRDSLTLDYTLNPDFSQVESDEPQVTVNQRFEVFFPERRPFFLENSGYFKTPIDLFFSRRIVDPEFGARLTGKIGRWALGVLAADDREPRQPGGSGDLAEGQRAYIGVARIAREFGKQSHVAAMATDRELGSSYSRVYALDTRLRLPDEWVLEGQAARSANRGADGSERSGPAYLANLYRSTRHTFFNLHYNDRSPDFQTEVGFIPRVDIRQFSQNTLYRFRPKGKPVLSHGASWNSMQNWNRAGRLQDWRAGGGWFFEMKGQTFIESVHRQEFELYKGIGFRKHTTAVSVFSERFRRVGLRGGWEQGSQINFSPPAGVAPFLAGAVNASVGVVLRPRDKLRVENTYLYSRLGGDPVIFNNHLLRTKVYYQFNREFSLRGIFDYNAVLPNSSLVDQERSKRLVSDVLFTYLLRPGTALYAGYTERMENFLFDPSRGDPPRRFGGPTFSTGRQFFVKMSYLWRF